MTKNKNSNSTNNSRKNGNNVHPVIEAGVIIVKLLVLVTALVVFSTSFMAHAEWYTIAVRTILAMLVVGYLGWYINWMLGKWVITYEMKKFEENNKLSSDKAHE
jgi:hypothetical protein